MKSVWAECASQIKKELKAKFPTIKFRIKSDSYSGGSSVSVYWTDGPTSAEVDQIIKKYQYGQFDGMIDCYEYSNKRDDIAQVKYVMGQRELSDETKAKIWNETKEKWGLEGDENQWLKEHHCYGYELVWRENSDRSFC